jgi:hypothetical protein
LGALRERRELPGFDHRVVDVGVGHCLRAVGEEGGHDQRRLLGVVLIGTVDRPRPNAIAWSNDVLFEEFRPMTTARGSRSERSVASMPSTF